MLPETIKAIEKTIGKKAKTPREIADATGMHIFTIYRAIHSGEIKMKEASPANGPVPATYILKK